MDRLQFASAARVSEALIYILENQNNAVTHPVIATRIAELCGANEAQHGMFVHRKHRGRIPPPRPGRELMITSKVRRKGRVRQANGCREVVKLNRKGRVLARYKSLDEAAAREPVSAGGITWRCQRRTMDEWKDGTTWRYADEWDAMSPAERAQDLRALPHADNRNRRAVVMLNREGRVVARYNSIKTAATDAAAPCTVIARRCARQIEGNEFKARGVTWRYADEWDTMSPAAKAADMKGNLGK